MQLGLDLSATATLEPKAPEPKPALARRGDPVTSYEAAASINVQRAENQVLETLRDLGGKAINNEIAEHIGCRVNASSPRMKPLERKGKVRRTEERRNRQIVWEIVE